MRGVIAALFGMTDYKRWSDPRSLEAAWETRTQAAAALVPRFSRVIEFGAGHGPLERFLDPTCTYVQSDIIARRPGTIVCDLSTRPFPDIGSGVYDVAVFMGVLEYIRDLPSVIEWLGQHIPMCVVSYVCADTAPSARRRMRQMVTRLRMGWMNGYREDELLSIFRRNGFILLHAERWQNNRLFVLSRRPIRPGAAKEELAET
jgi:hypothetical protein